MGNEQPFENTDRELFREDTGISAGSYYENSLFVTKEGNIGMNVGGTVYTAPIRNWHDAMRTMLEDQHGYDPPEPEPESRPAHWTGREDVDDIAEILMDAYCDAEELDSIGASYVATFVDMAKAVIANVRPEQLRIKPESIVMLRTGVPFKARYVNGDTVELTFTAIKITSDALTFDGQDVDSWLASNKKIQRMMDGLG